MTRPLNITLIAALVLLAACRSEPIAFHTLTPAHWSNSTQAGVGDIRIESISVPPQVEYALTDLGHVLLAQVESLMGWVRRHHAAILAARARFQDSGPED